MCLNACRAAQGDGEEEEEVIGGDQGANDTEQPEAEEAGKVIHERLLQTRDSDGP